MLSQQEIARAKRHKQKLLKKYLQSDQNKKILKSQQSNAARFFVKDNDEANQNSQIQEDLSQSQSSEENKRVKKRRVSSSEDQIDQSEALKKRIMSKKIELNKRDQENNYILKNKKLTKKFKKAFGIENDEQLQDFIKQMKIQGMQKKQIKKLLKSKKVQLRVETNDQGQKSKKQKKKMKKQKKKLKKQQKKDSSKLKFQAIVSQSGSSDIQVPEQARTIYRNKDGTIKMETEAEVKQKKKQQVYSKLAEWQKGMKKQDSDAQDNDDLAYAKNSVWDDPLKLWNQQNVIKPFQCKFQGPANRFNIKPGHRWDGVIRGNGFQNKLIQQQNLRKTNQARQHKQYLKNL